MILILTDIQSGVVYFSRLHIRGASTYVFRASFCNCRREGGFDGEGGRDARRREYWGRGGEGSNLLLALVV